MSLLSQIWDHLQDSRGRPQTLEKWLASVPASEREVHLPLTAASIAASDIVRWDRLGHFASQRPGAPSRPQGMIYGWQEEAGSYRHVEVHVPALAHLTRAEDHLSWQGDLRDIQGLSSSKSPLGEYASIAQFAQAACVGLLEPATPAHLDQLLAWDEIRLDTSKRQAPLACFSWDGRLMLMNEGGSHHVAAAQHVARQLDQPVPVSTRLQLHSFNAPAVDDLRHQFDMFVVPASIHERPEFFDGLRGVGATYYTLPLPAPHDHLRAVMLPRNEPRSVAVANVLRTAGFTDFGAALTSLAYGLARHPAAPRRANQELLPHAPSLADALKRPLPSEASSMTPRARKGFRC